jgi:hypothetical protein
VEDMPQATECVHGYAGTWGDMPARVVPCKDVDDCPAYAAPEFTEDDLRLITAMCKTACPQYPEVDMYPAWDGLYRRAQSQLANRFPEE